MTSETMRAIDRWVGPPLCFLLSLVHAVQRLFQPLRSGPVNGVKKILFVKPVEMGSTVLTYPTLMRTREHWPDCEIYFLVFAENVSAVHLLGLVSDDHIFTIRSDHPVHFLLDSMRAIARIRRMGIDVAVDLEFFSRGAALLTFLAGARYSSGFERYTLEGLYKGALLTHPVQYNPHIHTAAAFVTLIDALVQPERQVPYAKVPVLPREKFVLPPHAVGPPEQARILTLLKSTNPPVNDGSRYVILNVNSSDLMPLRRWPLANYIALGARLLQDPRVFIVLTGVPKEREESIEVERQLGAARCINLVGKTSLRELLALYTVCHLMITNDSGPSHFGCLTEIPTVTLFGPETPEIYGPLGKHKVAISAGLACSPCVSAYNHRRSPCNNNVCMQSISVEQVWKTCRELLQTSESELSLA